MRIDGKEYGIGRVVGKRKDEQTYSWRITFELDLGNEIKRYSGMYSNPNRFEENKDYVFVSGRDIGFRYVANSEERQAVLEEYQKICNAEKPKTLVERIRKYFRL